MRKFQNILCFIAAFTIIGCESKNKTPTSMMYNDKLIDPRCFASSFEPSASMTSTISLKTCSQYPEDFEDNQKEIKIKRTSDTGYDRFASYNQSFEYDTPAGDFEYEYIGSVDPFDVIQVSTSGGGSGTFSSVALLKRTGDKIELRILSSGDRAIGGIADVYIKDNKVIFKKYFTPAKIASLAKDLIGKPLLFEKSLPDCSSCYGGFGYFEINPNIEKESRLTHIDIDLNKFFLPENAIISKKIKQLVEDFRFKKTYSDGEIEYIQLDVKNFTDFLIELERQLNSKDSF